MPHTYSLAKLIHTLKTKELSCVELTTHYLKRIQEARHLNAFISVDEEQALHQARLADKAIAQGTQSPFMGIPIAHKDNLCTANMKTTCASKMLADFIPPYDATIVQRLSNAGTIMLGKTNMDEFAMGSSNESSYFGIVRNPWNEAHSPGGSSGGSAAAVAARLVPFATGSDTGGSIRQPAAFCGISGLKPTYGLVSRFGLVAYASSLDQGGLMAPSAEDLALILPLIAGFDEQDSTSVQYKVPHYHQTLTQSIRDKKIGLPTCFFHPQTQGAVQKAILDAIHVLEKAGAEIIEIDLELSNYWIPCYYALACAEASSNLARYDGIRFGHRTEQADNLRSLITQSRTEGFGSQVKRRILTGTHILSTELFPEGYIHAQKVRHMISHELQKALTKVDLLLGPTTPTCAHRLGESKKDSIEYQLSDVFTVAANLAGLPALSIPVGFHDGLPIGMQLMGQHFGEATLLQVAHQYQQATEWHTMIPPTSSSPGVPS